MLNHLKSELSDLKKVDRYRHLKAHQGIDFSSNDYLGLSRSQALKETLTDFIQSDRYQWTTSSRLINGTTQLHIECEQILAQFLGREACLLFNSGYNANLGVIETLCKDAIVFSDELNHASLIDGIKNSRCEKYIFKHNDMNHLEEILHIETQKTKFIITESVFSMDGTLVDLEALLSLCDKYDAFLILDEAHATGVFGKFGQGRLFGRDYNPEKTITIHTGGKALGSPGAFIGCSSLIKEYLTNKCRHLIYTTALSPLQVYQLQKSVEFISINNQRQTQLHENINYVNENYGEWTQSSSAIFPIIIPGNKQVCRLEEKLNESNFSTKAIRYPTVAKGKERIRLSIHADHTKEEIDSLFSHLKDILKSQNGETYQ